MKHRRARRVLGLSVVLLALGGYASGSAEEGIYPGLPSHLESGAWAGAPQTGITQSLKTRQWLQVPMHVLAAFSVTSTSSYPSSDPRVGSVYTTNSVYFVAPAGAEHNYGVSPQFSVRTVAFGAIPVEATVQLEQRRQADLPVPIVVGSVQHTYRQTPPGRPSPYEFEDSTIEDAITLRVTRLEVDGVDLHLGKHCQTTQPGKLQLAGKGWWNSDPTVDARHPWATGHFFPATGGVLKGSVDVPPFTGCLAASGEDVSRLLTSTVSGPDNPVQLNVGPPSCGAPLPPPYTGNNGPPPPGATTTEALTCEADLIPPLIAIP